MSRDWQGWKMRQRMRRQGVEDAGAEVPFMRPLIVPKTRRLCISKTDLRAQADAALAEWKARNE